MFSLVCLIDWLFMVYIDLYINGIHSWILIDGLILLFVSETEYQVEGGGNAETQPEPVLRLLRAAGEALSRRRAAPDDSFNEPAMAATAGLALLLLVVVSHRCLNAFTSPVKKNETFPNIILSSLKEKAKESSMADVWCFFDVPLWILVRSGRCWKCFWWRPAWDTPSAWLPAVSSRRSTRRPTWCRPRWSCCCSSPTKTVLFCLPAFLVWITDS